MRRHTSGTWSPDHTPAIAGNATVFDRFRRRISLTASRAFDLSAPVYGTAVVNRNGTLPVVIDVHAGPEIFGGPVVHDSYVVNDLVLVLVLQVPIARELISRPLRAVRRPSHGSGSETLAVTSGLETNRFRVWIAMVFLF
jgi:hypothetical protein